MESLIESLFESLDRLGSRTTAYVLGIVFFAGWYLRRSARRMIGSAEESDEADDPEPIERPRRRLPLD